MGGFIALVSVFCIFLPALIYNLYWSVWDSINFEYRNPYHRKCKKCGSVQEVYHYNGHEYYTWWERMYPLGNNEKCKCHSRAKK